MRLNSKLKAACLAGVAVVATLAAGEALAGGRGGGGDVAAGVAAAMSSVDPRSAAVSASAITRSGRPSPAIGALNRAYHGRYGGYGGYGGGGDYWGGYYGGGGVYYGDADYGYGYGGYYDDYAAGVPAAYSALTYPPNYEADLSGSDHGLSAGRGRELCAGDDLSGPAAHHLSADDAISRGAQDPATAKQVIENAKALGRA